MKLANTKPFLLKPYSVSRVVEDGEVVSIPTPAAALPLGRALLRSSTEGTPIVIAMAGAASPSEPTQLDYLKLARGVVAVGGEVFTGKAIAQGAWNLSSLSSTTTAEQLAKTLIANHVPPANAEHVAEKALAILGDPISRGILISISAGVATYVVVQRTTLAPAKKWAIILGVMAFVGAVFAVLYRMKLAA